MLFKAAVDEHRITGEHDRAAVGDVGLNVGITAAPAGKRQAVAEGGTAKPGEVAVDEDGIVAIHRAAGVDVVRGAVIRHVLVDAGECGGEVGRALIGAGACDERAASDASDMSCDDEAVIGQIGAGFAADAGDVEAAAGDGMTGLKAKQRCQCRQLRRAVQPTCADLC